MRITLQSKNTAMTITVFGATGQVGLQLIKQALWKGHTVRAFGRNVHELLDMQHDNLQLIKGALFDEGEVFAAIKGSDAVLSALGGGTDGTDKTRSLGMKNILQQMGKAGVNRIIGIGGLGVLQADEETLLVDTEGYPPQYHAVGKEHEAAWLQLAASNMQWTFVCPPNIMAADPTGQFVTNANYPPQPNLYRITTGDLAIFMLNELEQNAFVRQRVGIGNVEV